jgi:N-glycosylase/DNA lyase
MQNQITLPLIEFDPRLTFSSGQAFRWSPVDEKAETWIGIVAGNLIKLSKEKAIVLGKVGKEIDHEFVSNYLSADDTIDDIFSSFPSDAILDDARNNQRGLRLLTQEPWECLISFVCSINCNIPSIRNKIENLCRRYGSKIESVLGHPSFSFPTPESLSKATKRELLECNLGFRWKYVKFISGQIAAGRLHLEDLRKISYDAAQRQLISKQSGKTLGVGPKVADCALLYSLHKTQAFPIDVWILRCFQQYYRNDLQMKLDSLSQKKYAAISELMRGRFGPYAGYAQLYLYHMMRSSKFHSK